MPLTCLSRSFSERDPGAKTSKWMLFILPMVTVLREGMSLPRS